MKPREVKPQKLKTMQQRFALSDRYVAYLKKLPKADQQISNRMFKRFGWAFFIHTGLTMVFLFISKLILDEWGNEGVLALYEKSLVVYVPVFTAFLTKSAVENKAKITSGTVAETATVTEERTAEEDVSNG